MCTPSYLHPAVQLWDRRFRRNSTIFASCVICVILRSPPHTHVRVFCWNYVMRCESAMNGKKVSYEMLPQKRMSKILVGEDGGITERVKLVRVSKTRSRKRMYVSIPALVVSVVNKKQSRLPTSYAVIRLNIGACMYPVGSTGTSTAATGTNK